MNENEARDALRQCVALLESVAQLIREASQVIDSALIETGQPEVLPDSEPGDAGNLVTLADYRDPAK